MFSLSDEMVTNSSFVIAILDQTTARCFLWQFSNLTPRALSIQAKFLVGNSKNIPKWKGFPDIELCFQSHCLHEPFFRYLGFFLSSLQNSNAIRNAWPRLNKCLRTLNKCFVEKQITIFTFVFFRQEWPKNKVPLSVINQQIKSLCTYLLTQLQMRQNLVDFVCFSIVLLKAA